MNGNDSTGPNGHLLHLLDLSREMQCVIGRDGRLEYVSPTFKALGYEAQDLLGREFLDLIQAEDREAMSAKLSRGAGVEVRLESRFLRKDGAYQWVAWRAKRAADGTLFAVALDATERKWVRDELRASLSLVQATLDSTADGILVLDARRKIVTFNRKYREMWSLADDLIDGRDVAAIHDFVTAQLVDPIVYLTMFDRLESRATDEAYVVLEFKDGRIFESFSRPRWIEDSVEGRVWSFRDLTERTRAERELREHLSMGLEHAVEGICWVDDAGRFLAVNPVFATMAGYPDKSDLVGVEWTQTLLEADRERAARAFEGIVQAGKVEIEVRGAHKDGSIVHLRVLMVHGRNDGSGHRFFVKDISEQKKLQERLLLTDRMSSMGTLTAGVAHEINNPLSYVMANLGILIEDLPRLVAGQGEQRVREISQILDDMRDGTERVRRIVRDLKVFSRPDPTPNGPVDVRRVIEVAINMAYNEIRHRARLTKDYTDVPLVEANETELGQVFLNLLINAAQAIREGDVDQNEIRITTKPGPGDGITVEIRDTGSGIPPALMSRIFDPFFTTKPIGTGTGLGLSVCHGIVAKLGGQILVESEIGKGSSFRVVLRRAKTDKRPTTRPPARPTSDHPRSSVLIVDDEPLVAHGIRRMVERDHDARVCTSGQEALRAIAEGAAFDVILCDLMMPVMTGMDLHEELLRIDPRLADRVIFMSGGAFTARAREFLERVPNQRFEKPIDFGTLRAGIRALLRPPPS
jgi:two-component system, cell cycle sensor histidine kinase and response regulator CckA